MSADFTDADAAVTLAVTQFVNEIDSFYGKWEGIAPSYIVESLLLQLCAEVTEMADELKDEVAPATLKLLDALEYRDSRPEDR
jgi:hypothetical protein